MLKPKHIPESLYSLKQHFPKIFYPSLALFTHTLSLHDREQAVLNLVADNVCEAQSGACTLLWMRSKQQTVCPGSSVLQRMYKTLGFVLLEQIYLFFWSP